MFFALRFIIFVYKAVISLFYILIVKVELFLAISLSGDLIKKCHVIEERPKMKAPKVRK
jgi:hypothetical protein